MATWDELVSLALLGTEQSGRGETRLCESRSADDQSAVAQLLRKLEAAGKSRESVLLCAAGTLSLHGRAGIVPLKSSATRPQPAPQNDLPCVNVGVANLRLLIEQYTQTLLPIWLRAVAKANKRVPEAAVPLLLHFGENSKDFREPVAAVIGNRGRWLAAQNAAWSFAATGTIASSQMDQLKEIFETGNSDERIVALKELRRSEPNAARELVEANWKQEGHEQKVKFLESFALNLTMADEPFLEEICLEDKRKEVRTVAANWLSRLTHSRFHKRMVERAKPCLRVKGLLKQELDVSLPHEADASMIRDGFTKAPVPLTTNSRIEWLVYMLSKISPKVWEAEFRLSPEQILDDIVADATIRQAWGEAAVLHQDADWAEAMCCSKTPTGQFGDLLTGAKPELRERIVLRMIQKNKGLLYIQGNEYTQPIMVALLLANHDWSEDFGRKLIPVIVEQARQGVSYYGKQVFSSIGFYFPVSLMTEMERSFKEIERESKESVDKFLSTLKFKSELFGDLK
jgi:hypothetical protein